MTIQENQGVFTLFLGVFCQKWKAFLHLCMWNQENLCGIPCTNPHLQLFESSLQVFVLHHKWLPCQFEEQDQTEPVCLCEETQSRGGTKQQQWEGVCVRARSLARLGSTAAVGHKFHIGTVQRVLASIRSSALLSCPIVSSRLLSSCLLPLVMENSSQPAALSASEPWRRGRGCV